MSNTTAETEYDKIYWRVSGLISKLIEEGHDRKLIEDIINDIIG